VTWLELFFDLMFVIVIGQLAHKLSGEISPLGLLHFSFLFVPAWWLWVTGTYYIEYWETDDISIRVIMFALMLPVVGLALFVHDALGATFRGYALFYVAARLVLAALFARVARHDRLSRATALSYAACFLTVAVLISVSLLVPAKVRIALWVVALAIEFVMPLIVTLTIRQLLPHSRVTSKLPERFGLFTLIVLGETVVGVFQGLSGAHDITFGIAMTGALGIALAFEWWAIYFDFVAQRRVKEGIWWEYAWAYTHLFLVMSIVAIGACLYHVMKSGDSALAHDVKWLLVGAMAFALVAVSLIERTLAPDARSDDARPPRSVSKWVAAAAILALGLTGDSIGAARLLAGAVLILLVPAAGGMRAWEARRPEV
jgi:low temperature requirement protein LtrA